MKACLRWYSLCLPGNRILSLPCYLVLPFIYSIRTSRRRKRLRLPLPLEITAVDDLRYVERRFYPAGDVLLLYAIVGVVLFIVRKWSDKAVLVTAIIFYCSRWSGIIISLACLIRITNYPI